MKNRENLEILMELTSLTNQVKALRLTDKLGKQNFRKDMKKVFASVTKAKIDTSEDVTKTITGTSNKNNEALENLDNKLLEIMKDRGIVACYLLSLLSKINNPKHTSQFKLIEGPISNRVNDLLINKTVPVTLYDNLLTFHDTDNDFELEGDILKMITNKNYKVYLANLSYKKLMFEFAKQMFFDEKTYDEK